MEDYFIVTSTTFQRSEGGSTCTLNISEAQDTTQLKCNLIPLLKNYLSTGLLQRVTEDERDMAKLHVTENEEQIDCFDYFRFVKEIQNLQMLCNWREAFKCSSSNKFAII